MVPLGLLLRSTMNEDSFPAPPATFEDSLAALEAAVQELEEGRLGLAESLARYEESVKHLKHCYRLLESAEQKIELLTGVAADGSAQTAPFAAGSETLADAAPRRRKRRARPLAEPGDAGDAGEAERDTERDIDD